MTRRPSRTKPPRARALRQLLRDTRGGTAIEYGLIVALIVIVMMASFMAVADVTQGMWRNVSTKVTQAH
jgi:pilus assembly protein Flp/PilA